MLTVSGDFGKLRELAAKLERLAGPGAVRDLASVLAEEARELADEGFAGSHDPAGTPWAPLKVRAGQPLRDTGRLQRSFTKSVSSGGFTIRYSAAYGGYHQSGTSRMVARPMLPGDSMPARWATSFHEAAEEYLDSLMR